MLINSKWTLGGQVVVVYRFVCPNYKDMWRVTSFRSVKPRGVSGQRWPSSKTGRRWLCRRGHRQLSLRSIFGSKARLLLLRLARNDLWKINLVRWEVVRWRQHPLCHWRPSARQYLIDLVGDIARDLVSSGSPTFSPDKTSVCIPSSVVHFARQLYFRSPYLSVGLQYYVNKLPYVSTSQMPFFVFAIFVKSSLPYNRTNARVT